MDASPPPEEDQEWELRHDDDGFVYKILRRPGGPTDATAASDAKAAAVLNAQEHQRRTEKKKQTFLNLKAEYQSENYQWGILSNILKEMQERASLDVMESRPEEALRLEDPGPSGDDVEEGNGSKIDKLLAKGLCCR